MNPEKIIDAEVVPKKEVDELAAELAMVPAPETTPALGKKKKKPNAVYHEISMFDPTVRVYFKGRMSERERKFVQVYVKTGSVARASEEIGINYGTGKRWLSHPAVKRYVDHLRQRAARAADLTMDKIGAVLGAAVDGDTEVTPLQIMAAKEATRFLRPVGAVGVNTGHMTVNQQNNINISGPSPFADMDQSAMLDKLRENLLEMDD